MTSEAQNTSTQNQARPQCRHKNRPGLIAPSRRVLLQCQAQRHARCGRTQVAEFPANHRKSLHGKTALPRQHLEQPGIWLVGRKTARALQRASGSCSELAQQRIELPHRCSSQRIPIELELHTPLPVW